MKKALVIILIALTILCVLAGCDSGNRREGINSNLKFLHFVDENGNTLLDYQLDQYFSSDKLQKELDEIKVDYCTFSVGVYLDGTVFSVEKDKINDYLLNHDYDLTIPKKVLFIDATWAAYTVRLYFAPNEYAINYVNVDGATFDGPDTYNIDSDLTLPTPVKKYHRFLGWTEYGADSSATITSLPSEPRDITLEAHWQQVAFTVAYDGLPAGIANDNKTSITLSDGIYNLNNIPSTSAYTFNGWKLNGKLVTSLDPDELWNADADYSDPDACTVTLVADVAFTEFTVKYYADDQLIANQTFDFRTKDSLQAPVVPAKEHYTGSWSEEVAEFKDYEIHAIYDVEQFQVAVDTGLSGYPFETQSYVWDTKYQAIYEQLSYPNKKLIGLYFDADFNDRVNEDSFITGSGTLYAKWISEYKISTAADWNLISQDPYANFILTTDINFQAQPIPTVDSFGGVLDGQGHTVYGFINNVNDTSNIYALFRLNVGTICNLNFYDGVYSVETAPCAAGATLGFLCATNRGTIQEVTVNKVTITLNHRFSVETASGSIEPAPVRMGVFAGINLGTIRYSTLSDEMPKWAFEATVQFVTSMSTADNKMGNNDYIRLWTQYGAFVGCNEGEIDHVTLAGSVYGMTRHVQNEVGAVDAALGCYYKSIFFIQQQGGIVGNNAQSATVSNALVEASVGALNSTNYGVQGQKFYGIVDVGGIVGDNNGTIDKCQTGEKSIIDVNTESETRVGGICAVNEGNTAIIRACYSQAEIDAVFGSMIETDTMYFGGIVGLNSAAVTHCYAVVTNVSFILRDDMRGNMRRFGGLFGQSSVYVVKSFNVFDVANPRDVLGVFGSGEVRDCYFYLKSDETTDLVIVRHLKGKEGSVDEEELFDLIDKMGFADMGYTVKDGEYPVLADVGDNRVDA